MPQGVKELWGETMNFLGIGPFELVLILVLALIFLGPEELPRVARTLGRIMRDLQALSNEVSTQVQKELGPELEQLERTTRSVREVTSQAQKVQDAVRHPTKALQQEVRTTLNPTDSQGADDQEGASQESAQATEVAGPSSRPLTPLATEGEPQDDSAGEGG